METETRSQQRRRRRRLQPWQLYTALFVAFTAIAAYLDHVLTTAILCVACGISAEILTKLMSGGSGGGARSDDATALQPWQIFTGVFVVFWALTWYLDHLLITVVLCAGGGVAAELVTKLRTSGYLGGAAAAAAVAEAAPADDRNIHDDYLFDDTKPLPPLPPEPVLDYLPDEAVLTRHTLAELSASAADGEVSGGGGSSSSDEEDEDDDEKDDDLLLANEATDFPGNRNAAVAAAAPRRIDEHRDESERSSAACRPTEPPPPPPPAVAIVAALDTSVDEREWRRDAARPHPAAGEALGMLDAAGIDADDERNGHGEDVSQRAVFGDDDEDDDELELLDEYASQPQDLNESEEEDGDFDDLKDGPRLPSEPCRGPVVPTYEEWQLEAESEADQKVTNLVELDDLTAADDGSCPATEWDASAAQNMKAVSSTLLQAEVSSTLLQEKVSSTQLQEVSSSLLQEKVSSTQLQEEVSSTLLQEVSSTLLQEEVSSTLQQKSSSTLLQDDVSLSLQQHEERSSMQVQEETSTSLIKQETSVMQETSSSLIQQESSSTMMQRESLSSLVETSTIRQEESSISLKKKETVEEHAIHTGISEMIESEKEKPADVVLSGPDPFASVAETVDTAAATSACDLLLSLSSDPKVDPTAAFDPFDPLAAAAAKPSSAAAPTTESGSDPFGALDAAAAAGPTILATAAATTTTASRDEDEYAESSSSSEYAGGERKANESEEEDFDYLPQSSVADAGEGRGATSEDAAAPQEQEREVVGAKGERKY